MVHQSNSPLLHVPPWEYNRFGTLIEFRLRDWCSRILHGNPHGHEVLHCCSCSSQWIFPPIYILPGIMTYNPVCSLLCSLQHTTLSSCLGHICCRVRRCIAVAEKQSSHSGVRAGGRWRRRWPTARTWCFELMCRAPPPCAPLCRKPCPSSWYGCAPEILPACLPDHRASAAPPLHMQFGSTGCLPRDGRGGEVTLGVGSA